MGLRQLGQPLSVYFRGWESLRQTAAKKLGGKDLDTVTQDCGDPRNPHETHLGTNV